MGTLDQSALDDLKNALAALEFDQRDDVTGLMSKLKLDHYQIAALSNLAPTTVDAAQALLPSLTKRGFTEEEVEQMLAILRRAGSKTG